MAREGTADDGHQLGAGAVMLIELAAALEPDARRLEVAGRDGREPRREIGVVRRLEPGNTNEVARLASSEHRHGRRHRDARDAWQLIRRVEKIGIDR